MSLTTKASKRRRTAPVKGNPAHERKRFRLPEHQTVLIDEEAKRYQVTESEALRRLLDELIERRGAGRKSA